MVVLISSYLFGEETVHLNSIYWHDEDKTQQYWTMPYIPGKRSYDKPVYVLISKVTFSGGEEFAYNLKSRQRATLEGIMFEKYLAEYSKRYLRMYGFPLENLFSRLNGDPNPVFGRCQGA